MQQLSPIRPQAYLVELCLDQGVGAFGDKPLQLQKLAPLKFVFAELENLYRPPPQGHDFESSAF